MGSTRSSKPILPPEIILFIIDCLRNDPSALAACGLVGRSWVSRSRYHLFHTLKLRETRDAMVPRFLELLNPTDSTHSTFPSGVRHIILDQVVRSNLEATSIPLSHSLISHLSEPTFDNVDALTILMHNGVIPMLSATLLSSVFRNITSLVLQKLKYEEISPVFITLSSFPALEILDFSAALPPGPPMRVTTPRISPMASYLQSPPQLRSLKLSCSHSQSIYRWLSSPHQDLPNLKELELSDTYEEPQYLGPLFTKLGSVLEALSLTFNSSPPNCKP